jgi:hypothetical protein
MNRLRKRRTKTRKRIRVVKKEYNEEARNNLDVINDNIEKERR